MKKFLLMLLTLTTVLGLLLGTVGCTFLPNDPTEPTVAPTEPVADPTEPPTAPTEPIVDTTLEDAKTAAKAELECYAKAEDYREAQQAELAAAIEAGKAAIDAAVDVAAVDSALSAAKTVIDGIKTDAELTAEEEAATLAAAKTDAKAALDAFANPADYREAQQAELATAIANGKTAIDSATDVDAVNAALADAKATIDALETDAELTVKEEAAALATAKTDAKAALDTYVNADDYRAAEKLVLAAAIAEGKTAIDNATDIQTVNATLIGVKAAIDEIKTDAQLTAEEAAALAAAKTDAKAALDAFANPADYREAQQAELATAIANGKTAIDGAADIASVEAALAAAKAAIDAIDTDAEITAKSPTITTPITDGMVLTNNRATLDVIAKDASGKKLSYTKVTVTVNGIAATVNWDDQIKTSYNFVFEAGENTVIITATDGDYSTTVTYTVTCDLEAATTITVSIEACSVGLGYIVTPYKLTLDEATLTDMAGLYGYADAAEMKEKLSAAHCLDYTLYLHGLTMDYQGSLESTYNGFYMSSISGIPDTSNLVVPEELQMKLEENGYWPEPYVYDEGTLCEFDVTWGSGWMYVMNNSFPNVPFCDYVPSDGDVMRVQFTLAYGSDIGDWGMMGDPFFEVVDRDELTELIAEAIEAGVDYSEALEVVSTFGVTQDELDAACEALRAQLG